MNYTQHKLSAAFPAMTDGEFQGLVADIGVNGQRHPIIIFEGAVIDGWHRLRACNQLGIRPEFRAIEEDVDPIGYVISLNFHRRHLSASQRAGAIVACNEWRSDGQRGAEKLRTGAELPQTAVQMAETAQVSTRTIESAKAAQTAGFGELIRDGKIDAKPAAELSRKAPEIAARVVAKEITPEQGKEELKSIFSGTPQSIGRVMRDGTVRRPPGPPPNPKRELPTVPGPDLNAQIDRLCSQLDDMRAELIELRAASHDEQLRNQARDEIAGLREALALEQQLHAALKSQRETVEHQVNVWKSQCESLQRQLKRRERGE